MQIRNTVLWGSHEVRIFEAVYCWSGWFDRLTDLKPCEIRFGSMLGCQPNSVNTVTNIKAAITAWEAVLPSAKQQIVDAAQYDGQKHGEFSFVNNGDTLATVLVESASQAISDIAATLMLLKAALKMLEKVEHATGEIAHEYTCA